MSNPMRKSNEGFRARGEGQMHRVTVDIWLPGNPGEINVLRNAATCLDLLARLGYMPNRVQSVTREVLDTPSDV